ncbi:MAG: 30S ribosomal protein S4 [Clostridia bacterium]|nr:30S ribosomal protein S4 [Clostridia bacterium]
MARYTDASCRLCRREGEKLFLKGTRCYTEKCALSRPKRSYAPGQHGMAKKKQSEYCLQLREKQKTKRYYGVLEKQFHGYFELANKKKGVTGENLLSILETRLDNVVYRMGLGSSRAEARQFVRHGFFTVNGKAVNIPSYLVSANDVIEVTEKYKSNDRLAAILEVTAGRAVPAWLSVDLEKLSATVVALPKREDIDFPVQEHLIVELYSK